MEVKINREIRDYTESMFFGLSMRQFFFSVLAVAAAVAVYPSGAMGFVKYNGMPAEKFIAVWFRDQFIMPKKLIFGNTNIWYELLRPEDSKRRKEKKDA